MHPSLLLALLLAGCAGEKPAEEVVVVREGPRPNILIIDIDSLRNDRVGATRKGVPLTPNVDALAARGTRFTHAIAQSGWTLPSLAALLASHHPPTLRSRDLQVAWIAPDSHVLPEILGLYGYTSAVFWGRTLPHAMVEYRRGFDTVDAAKKRGPKPPPGMAFQKWLAKGPKEPWLALVHDFDLHNPAPTVTRDLLHRFAPDRPDCRTDRYQDAAERLTEAMGQEAAREHARGHYDGAVAYSDEAVGKILAAVEQAGETQHTVVVFTSDHGEELFERGRVDHGPAYEYNLRIPLVVVDPRVSGGPRTVTETVQTIDLTPTLLEIAGVPVDQQMAGTSLMGAMRGEEPPPSRDAFIVVDREAIALRTDAYKLMRCGSAGCSAVGMDRVGAADTQIQELYDLEDDPEERHEISAERPGVVAELGARLDRWEEVWRREAEWVPRMMMSAEQQETLKEQGYWDRVKGSEGP